MQVFGLPRQMSRGAAVARATLYRWEKRLRSDFPMWGRARLGPLIRLEGFAVSDMTVGRIIAHLVERGAAEPVPIARRAAKTRRWTARRHHDLRLPKGLKPDRPGGIVQIDTVCVQVGPQSHVKHFTAYDPVARWTVGKAFRRATAAAATDFLAKVRAGMPFKVEAIQVDGGSEFKARFEMACRDMGIVPYELPPKSPRLNAGVERCNGAWRYEFHACYDAPTQLINPLIDSFQTLYNHHRPHGALGGRSPADYLRHRTQGSQASHNVLNPDGNCPPHAVDSRADARNGAFKWKRTSTLWARSCSGSPASALA